MLFKLSYSKAKSQNVRSHFGSLLYIKFRLIDFWKTKFKFIIDFAKIDFKMYFYFNWTDVELCSYL